MQQLRIDEQPSSWAHSKLTRCALRQLLSHHARVQAAAADNEQLELDIRANRPEAADQAQIEALIAQHLSDGLQLIPEDVLATALQDFVEKVGPGLLPGH